MSGMTFICKSIDENEIPKEIVENRNFSFPKVHTNSKDISNLSKQIKNHKKDVICIIPFCSTVEVEALGGVINLGDQRIGPRVNCFSYNTLEELKNMRDINLIDKRIKEVLDSIEILSEGNEIVSLNVAGPFMILTSLIDPLIFYKAIRKDRDSVKEVLDIVEDNIIKYIREALKSGAKIISFGDSVGTVDIVGPKVYKDIVGDTMLNVLKRIEKLEDFKGAIVHLCGKTSVSLEKYGFITSKPLEFKEDLTYGQALIEIINNKKDIKFVGHSCMKKTPIQLKNSKVWEINLNNN